MLSYVLVSLASVAVTLGGQGAAKALRSRGSQPVQYATIEMIEELARGRAQHQAILTTEVVKLYEHVNGKSTLVMNSLLEELKIESDAREALAQGLTQEREALAAAGGIATRGEVSAALEQLHKMHQGQVEGLHRALVNVARQLELATASPSPAQPPVMPPPNWLPPLRQESESLFPEGVATVPLRPINREAADPYQGAMDPSLDPSQLLAGLQALRGFSGVPQ